MKVRIRRARANVKASTGKTPASKHQKLGNINAIDPPSDDIERNGADRDEPSSIEGGKARRRLDRPGRRRYANGGDVGDALQQFKNIERSFSSPQDSAPPPALRQPTHESISAPAPYSEQNKNWVVPSLDPAQGLERFKQTMSQFRFAKGGNVGGKGRGRVEQDAGARSGKGRIEKAKGYGEAGFAYGGKAKR